MPGDGRIQKEFGGEERDFRVALGELRAIQAKCDAGPPVVAQRLARCVQLLRQFPKATILDLAAAGLGEWLVDDVREPILQGLISGGMQPNDAGKLVRTWIDERGFQGLVENADLALTLIVAGVETDPDDALGEAKAGARKATSSREARSASPGSTARGPRSASRRAKSTK